jgi:hypothetical protein
MTTAQIWVVWLPWHFRRLARLQPPTGHRLALAWTGLVLSLLAVPAAASPAPVAIRLAVILAFVAFGPGAAFVSAVRLGDAVSSWAMALVVSLALSGAVATIMLWFAIWNPVGGYAAIAIPSALVAAAVLLPTWYHPPTGPDPRPRPRRPKIPTERKPDLDFTRIIPPIRDRALPPVPPPYNPFGPAVPSAPAVTSAPPAPALDAPSLDATIMLPRFTDHPSRPVLPASRVTDDMTIQIPVIREPLLDAEETGLIPMADYEATGLIPRQRDETSLVPAVRDSQPTAQATLERAEPEPAPLSLRAVTVEAGFVVAIVAAWLVSLANTSTENVGDYGLLAVIHPAFFVAIGLCVLRFVVEIAQKRWRGWVLVTHTIVLIVIMHASVPLLIFEPEYAWTYKHIGLVELFRTAGHITDPQNIYHGWPTFFAFGAHLVAGTGISTLRVAAWAPLFFNLGYCLLIFAITRTLATDRRVPFLAVFIFEAINWVAQDYFAPQAYAYLLCLGTLLIMVRWLRRTTITRGGGPSGRLGRLWNWASSGLAELPYTSKTASRAAIGVLYFVYAVVVSAHQLSPYLIAISAAGLAALGLIRPMRIVPILGVIAITYLLPRYQIVDAYGLFDGFNLFSNAATNSPVGGAASAGRVFSGEVVRFIALAVWGLSALTVLAFWRKPGPVAAPAVLAFSPFALLFAQSYGGEAIYRVYFFSSPWCAYLIAMLVLRNRWLPRGAAVPAATLALTATVFGSMQARHGHLSLNQFTRSEIDAAEFIYANARPGSDILLAAASFPDQMTANYDQFHRNKFGVKTIITSDDQGPLRTLPLTPDDLPTINSFIDESNPTYLIFGKAMAPYLHYFGYAPDGKIEQLERTIAGSPNWHIYYVNKDVTIYTYVP